jgi:hypothetical protein
MQLRTRASAGLFAVPLVHCAVLVERAAAGRLKFDDGSGRHDWIVMADSARKAGVRQYIANRPRTNGFVLHHPGATPNAVTLVDERKLYEDEIQHKIRKLLTGRP